MEPNSNTRLIAGTSIDWLSRNVLLGFALEDKQTGKLAVLTDYVFEDIPEGVDFPRSAMLELTPAAASHLLDTLIKAGVRPTDGVGEPAHVKALQAHLADLQRLVFKTK